MTLTPYIKKRLEKKGITLMTHAIVGYPSLEANWTMLESMRDADVDLVELQMPFSEPMADGPTFVRANQEALRRGMTVKDYFEFMKKATAEFDFPILMMGYYNTAFCLGHEAFCRNLKESGAKGFILPDLPLEEYGDLFDRSEAAGLDAIMLTTPTTSGQRLAEIAARARGFIYCVARRGVTGLRTSLDGNVGNFLDECRRHTDLPLALGFGLGTGEDLQSLVGKAEMAIVGTALLRTWEEDGPAAYHRHMLELGEATRKSN